MKDITFERDQLDRADQPADWGDFIPFDGEVYPPDADPTCPPTKTELAAAAVFDAVLARTGDVFEADRAMVERLRLDGNVEAVLDACSTGLLSIEQTAEQMRRMDEALPAQVDKSQGIMYK